MQDRSQSEIQDKQQLVEHGGQQDGLTRRQFMGMLGGAPFMLSGASLLSLAACNSDSSAAATTTATATSVSFNNMAAPTSYADRTTTFTNATIDVKLSDGTVKAAQPLAYKRLYKTGDVLTRPDGGKAVAGGYYDVNNNPIIDNSTATPVQYYSDCPDGQSLIRLSNPAVSGIDGNTLFMVTQFEYQTANLAQGEARPTASANQLYGKLPSQFGISTLSQDKKTGELSVVYYYPVPTASVHGLWITCASSLSPWNTHLASEEYEPDAWYIAMNGNDPYAQFRAFGLNTFGSETAANPYHYGHVPEVTVNPNGTGSLKKHFCLGRISREKVQVMPDNRTVLMGDDATSGIVSMFVADLAGDLSSGTLYAAKMTQTSAAGATDGGAFTMSWIKLGHASSSEIEALANSLSAQAGPQPGAFNAARGIIADVVLTKTAATSGYNLINFANGSSLYVKASSDLGTAISTEADLAGYTLVNYGNAQQFVKFVGTLDTSNKAAAFLETHRFAAAMGATAEFTKFEGVTVNAKDKKAYFAMSSIKDTMTSNSFINNPITGTGPATGNVIKLAKISAGGTYEVILGTDATIGSDYVPQSLSVPVKLLGEDLATPDQYGNTANIDKIANPDNLWYSESMRTLFIGEDSGMHVNNYTWSYNVDTATLSRIYSAPSGAECTGLQVVDNYNGFAYVMSNFQHPGDWESIHNTLLNATGSELNADTNANWNNKRNGAVGYIGGVPALS